MFGEVVKLDRGLPLVRLDDGRLTRCELATALVKGSDQRAVIGDAVEVDAPDAHDVCVIVDIRSRRTQFVRKDPTERALPQVLASNFDRVMVVQPAGDINMRRLQRELVLAFETGAQVAVLLTKADLVEGDDEKLAKLKEAVAALAGPKVPIHVMSAEDEGSIEQVRSLMTPGSTTVLIGRSGVGKSTLVNILAGSDIRKTGHVRARDGKGRHTTVSREIIELPNGGRVVDMPGVRGLGLWEAQEGIDAVFQDIEQLAQDCRFRDCRHIAEPGCAVRAALESGELSQKRYDYYQQLCAERDKVARRRRESNWR